MDIMWFGIGIAFIILELLNFGLVSIWFALGAFVAMFFEENGLQVQFYIFAGVSLLSALLIRKKAMTYIKKNKSKELDRITEKKVKIEEIRVNGKVIEYTVYLDGKLWTGISEEEFQIGDVAVVEKVRGNKLILIK